MTGHLHWLLKSYPTLFNECINHSPGDDNFVIAARRGRPFPSSDGPVFIAKTGPFLRGSTDRVKSWNDIRRTVGEIRTARNRRFVYVHWVRIFERRKSVSLNVDQY